jgi:hypothetical protein
LAFVAAKVRTKGDCIAAFTITSIMSRQEWYRLAEKVAQNRTGGMSDMEQNEFWLEHNRLFLPFSNLSKLQEFCGYYLMNDAIQGDICMECDSTRLVQDEGHCDTICESCGIIQPWPVCYKNTRLTEGQAYISKKGYIPEDHMAAILMEMQCGRSRDLQSMIYDVHQYLVQHKQKLTFLNVRTCLRRLGYKQHYLMLPSLLHGLDREKFKPWILEPDKMRQIQGLFFQYKLVFERLDTKKEKRKNHLNYHFLLIEFCKMLDITDIPWHFLRVPQGSKSMQQHQRVWNYIRPQLEIHQ